MTDPQISVDLEALRWWATRTNPDRPEYGKHNYDARCPWCRETVGDDGHVHALELFDVIDKLRAEVAMLQAELAERPIKVDFLRLYNDIDFEPVRPHDLLAPFVPPATFEFTLAMEWENGTRMVCERLQALEPIKVTTAQNDEAPAPKGGQE